MKPFWTRYADLRRSIYQRDGKRCVLCGVDLSGVAYEVDHIKPRVEGGTNAKQNLRTLCQRCHRLETNELLARRAKERRFQPQPTTKDRQRPCQTAQQNAKGNATNAINRTMKIEQSQGKEFELCPAEQHQAVVCDVIDGGWEARMYQGQYKGVGRRLKLVFQTSTVDSEDHRFLVFDFPFFVSWDNRSGWFKRMAGILGTKAVEEIINGGEFLPESLIGRNVMLSIVHNASASDSKKVYANIDNVSPWNAKFAPPIVPEFYKRRCEGEEWQTPYPSAFDEEITTPEAETILRDQGRLPIGLNEPMPATNGSHATSAAPVRPNPAPQAAVPADYQPNGVKMPNASDQAKAHAKKLAKEAVASPTIEADDESLSNIFDDEEQPTLGGMPAVAQEANTAFAR